MDLVVLKRWRLLVQVVVSGLDDPEAPRRFITVSVRRAVADAASLDERGSRTNHLTGWKKWPPHLLLVSTR